MNPLAEDLSALALAADGPGEALPAGPGGPLRFPEQWEMRPFMSSILGGRGLINQRKATLRG